MNIQNEVQKIHNQNGMSEKANYKIQLLCEQHAKEYLDSEVKKLNIPVVMPRISHFIDENGNSVNINAGGVNVVLKQDGTHEYFRSYGLAGRMQLTPVYVA